MSRGYGTATLGSKFNGSYNGLSIGSGGVAATFAGFTVGGNVIGGKMNGQLGLQPSGRRTAGRLSWLGAKYVAGPFTVGIVGEEYWEQGTVQLSGITQRRGRGIDVGVSYTVAPGFTVFAEYLWNDQTQSARNFVSGAIGTQRRFEPPCQQQHQGSGLPDRQRRELLSSAQPGRNGRRGAIPAALSLYGVRQWNAAGTAAKTGFMGEAVAAAADLPWPVRRGCGGCAPSRPPASPSAPMSSA